MAVHAAIPSTSRELSLILTGVTNRQRARACARKLKATCRRVSAQSAIALASSRKRWRRQQAGLICGRAHGGGVCGGRGVLEKECRILMASPHKKVTSLVSRACN